MIWFPDYFKISGSEATAPKTSHPTKKSQFTVTFVD